MEMKEADSIEQVIKLYFQGMPLEQALKESNLDISVFGKLLTLDSINIAS